MGYSRKNTPPSPDGLQAFLTPPSDQISQTARGPSRPDFQAQGPLPARISIFFKGPRKQQAIEKV